MDYKEFGKSCVLSGIDACTTLGWLTDAIIKKDTMVVCSACEYLAEQLGCMEICGKEFKNEKGSVIANLLNNLARGNWDLVERYARELEEICPARPKVTKEE